MLSRGGRRNMLGSGEAGAAGRVTRVEWDQGRVRKISRDNIGWRKCRGVCREGNLLRQEPTMSEVMILTLDPMVLKSTL